MLPKHSDVAVLLVTSLVLCSGPIVGVVLAKLLAPGSSMAVLIGVFLLPCAHLTGRVAWGMMGFMVDPKSELRRVTHAFNNLGRRIQESQALRDNVEDGRSEGRFPRGGLMFILAHALLAFVAGLAVGLFLTDVPVTTVMCVYTFTGVCYGALVYFIALKGYLLMQSERAD